MLAWMHERHAGGHDLAAAGFAQMQKMTRPCLCLYFVHAVVLGHGSSRKLPSNILTPSLFIMAQGGGSGKTPQHLDAGVEHN